MSIIGMFKRLISGASAEPAQQVQKRAAKSKPKIITTIEESQNNKIDTWKDNQDVISGLQFIATLQLRTPLRVLLRHGEIHMDISTEPPKIINEMWEGIWIEKTKTYRELGIDIDEMKPGTHASDVGQVLPDDYLPFLIAIRKIVELDEPIENRINKLRTMPILGEWKTYVEKHGGIEKIIRHFFSGFIDIIPIAIRGILELNDSIENRIDKLREMPVVSDWKSYLDNHGGIEAVIERFFPKFLDAIPKLNLSTKDELSKLCLNTPNSIAAAPDKTLLNIKGIGKAKLKAIRDYCDCIKDNRDSYRTDCIEYVIRTCNTDIVEDVIR